MFDAPLEQTVGDTAYHVVVGGSGPPVLLLHGFPQTHLCWDRVAPALAERHTVVLVDLRGYGASTAPPGGPRGEGYTTTPASSTGWRCSTSSPPSTSSSA
jgi:haloacetate dehalogenase